MAYAPSVEGVAELRTRQISQPADAFETLPIANDGIAGQQTTRNTQASGELIAALLYLLSAGIAVIASLFLLLGLGFGEWLTVLLGGLGFYLAYLLFQLARPEAEWRRRAHNRPKSLDEEILLFVILLSFLTWALFKFFGLLPP